MTEADEGRAVIGRLQKQTREARVYRLKQATEQMHVMRQRRDHEIARLSEDGMSRREVAQIAGLTPARVQQIVNEGRRSRRCGTCGSDDPRWDQREDTPCAVVHDFSEDPCPNEFHKLEPTPPGLDA